MNTEVIQNMKNKILRAISNDSKVLIKYLSTKNEVTERLISDLEFTDEFDKFGYYGEHIKAYCHLRNNERNFKIDRILSFEIVEDKSAISDIIVPAQEATKSSITKQQPLHQQKVVPFEPEQKHPTQPPIIRTNTHKNNSGSKIALWFWGCLGIIFLIWIFVNNDEEITRGNNPETATPSRSNYTAQSSFTERQYSNKSPSPPASSNESGSSTPKIPNDQDIREAQQLLTDLSYNPGSVDGSYGLRTSDAVKAFQRDAGIPQNGWVDENLLAVLRRAKVAYQPLVSPSKLQKHANLQSDSSTHSASNTKVKGFFTRGSHQDDVQRVQGIPATIKDYSALGYEEWWYGDSSVKISTVDRRVTTWANLGNLKVRISPGPNITSSKYFTRNSHQDDVIRLQGTPDNINDYSAPGYEFWKYGHSSVQISTHDKKVFDWSNKGNNLNAR